MIKSVIIGLLMTGLIACHNGNKSHGTKPVQNLSVDYLIINGNVYSGTSNHPEQLVIGICQQVICYLGKNNEKNISIDARQIIDASNLAITPGFIDPHTHSLEELLSNDKNLNANYLAQGVTTVINGNDGEGSFLINQLSDEITQNGIGTNVALMVGHNAIRTAVMGKANRPPSDHEMATMKQYIKHALEAGAVGFSSGLYYVPGIYSNTDEVIELAKVAAQYDVLYDSHIRDESSFSIGFIDAIKEFIEIIEAAQIQGHIAHIKALGVDVWGQSTHAIELINQAKERGLKITADQYPWQASGTFLHNAVIPKWALEGERSQVLLRLSEPTSQNLLLSEIKENIRKRGGPETLLITASNNSKWLGKYLADIAIRHQVSAEQMVLDMMQHEETRIASFNMSSADIINFMQQSWVVTSSDGTNGHPRKYASFPTKYQQFVANDAIISLPQFINNSSAKTASIFGIKDRGQIAPGMQADINIIDFNRYKANADFSNWDVLSEGVVYQFVNGQASIIDGRLMKSMHGQVVLKK